MSGHRPVAPCGTKTARNRHRRRNETCEACTPVPRHVQPCGTYSARRRHARNGETCTTCGPIQERGGRAPAPCGTTQARKRHTRKGEKCEVCDATRGRTPQPAHPCGTPAAYRRHQRANETPCEPCATAYRADREQYRRARGVPPRNILAHEELAAEIEFLLNAGEGEHRILQAINITPGALERRLHRANRADLITRIFEWKLAA